MSNSESGRKLNQAVNTTSKAVGGALSQAKGAFSNWWSSITTPPIIASTPPVFPSNNDKKLNNSHIDQECYGNGDHDNDDRHPINDGESTCLFTENTEPICFTKSDAKIITGHDSNPSKEGIVEIAKEADILDSNR